jgi:hypothetical protein
LNFQDIIQTCKDFFGEDNVEFVLTDAFESRIKIEYPDTKNKQLLINILFEKLVWGEEVIVVEVLNVVKFKDEDPFIYNLVKNINIESSWLFPIEKEITPAYIEFILEWVLEYLGNEVKKNEILESYIQIRKDPVAQLRDWKLRKFLR